MTGRKKRTEQDQTTELTQQVERKAKREAQEEPPVEFLSTGSILLNLAASQKGRDGGWGRGRVINIVGDRSTGKTALILETCAQAFYNMVGNKSKNFPEVKKIIIAFNNVENVMDFPLVKMYGQKFVDGVEWINDGEDYKGTCQEFGRDFLRRLQEFRKGECLIYVADTLDAMTTEESLKRTDDAIKKDKIEDGTYGTEKAKYFSQTLFNQLTSRIGKKDATLFCISQVRENLNSGMFGKKHYRAGGKALDFYAHQVVWLYNHEKLKKTRNLQERVYGIRIKAKFEKNKVALPFRDATFTILLNYGIDDIGTLIDYMFGPKAKKIHWGDEDYSRNDFITLIESDNNEYEKLVEMVEEDWENIEKLVIPDRKQRF